VAVCATKMREVQCWYNPDLRFVSALWFRFHLQTFLEFTLASLMFLVRPKMEKAEGLFDLERSKWLAGDYFSLIYVIWILVSLVAFIFFVLIFEIARVPEIRKFHIEILRLKIHRQLVAELASLRYGSSLSALAAHNE